MPLLAIVNKLRLTKTHKFPYITSADSLHYISCIDPREKLTKGEENEEAEEEEKELKKQTREWQYIF